MDCQVEQPIIPATKKLSVHEQNGVVQPLLTDLYQITMAYAYWKNQKRSDRAVFDLYFRKNPFNGEFTIFAGLEECIKYLKNFKFTYDDIEYLQSVLPAHTDPEFYTYLLNLNTNEVTLYAIEEGTVVFPKVPLLRLEGPLPVVQLLETTLLTLVNYASLVATNAARFRLAVGDEVVLLEFGLRRAQGPDGGLSASKYCYMGGFDGTSNVLAGKLFGIPIKGTHAHAFISSFTGLAEVQKNRMLKKAVTNEEADFVTCVDLWITKLAPLLHCLKEEVHSGEQAAFIAYARAFPTDVLCLVDTYDVIRSGVPNFCAVAMALNDFGYRAKGIRLDSGDLAYLSKEIRRIFKLIAEKFNVPWFASMTIVASNDINEETIHSLNNQGHSINCFGIGTHLVTCQKQPALGCVFKLVEVNNTPRMKLSEDVEKVTMPGKKDAYRLYGNDGHALVDLLQKPEEPAPVPGKKVLCRHPFVESKRAYVSPARVEPLLKPYWKNGQICQNLATLSELRQRSLDSLEHTRTDHKRALNPTPYKEGYLEHACQHTRDSLSQIRSDHKRYLNPTPYKVSVTSNLYSFIHDLWMQDAPIGELS